MRKFIFILLAGIGGLVSSCGGSKSSDPVPTTATTTTGTGTTPSQTTYTMDATLANTDTGYVAVALQTDGKMVVVTTHQVKRLNKDGSNDNSFTTQQVTDGEFKTVAIQKDGKIWVGGSFNSFYGKRQHLVNRLNTDGSFDTTLDPNLGNQLSGFVTGGDISVIITLSDGNTLLGGNCSYVTAINYSTLSGPLAMIRLKPDGSLDNSFFANVYTGAIKAINYDAVTGKLLVTGYDLRTYNSAYLLFGDSYRMTSSGTLDQSFRFVGGLQKMAGIDNNAYGDAICVQSDGKILIGGYFDSASSNTKYQNLVRLNADGSIDASFIPPIGLERITALFRTSDNKILVGVKSSTMKQAIYVLNADGSIDNTVVLNFPHFGNISMITADADNNIILIGRLNVSQTSSLTEAKGIIRLKKS